MEITKEQMEQLFNLDEEYATREYNFAGNSRKGPVAKLSKVEWAFADFIDYGDEQVIRGYGKWGNFEGEYSFDITNSSKAQNIICPASNF